MESRVALPLFSLSFFPEQGRLRRTSGFFAKLCGGFVRDGSASGDRFAAFESTQQIVAVFRGEDVAERADGKEEALLRRTDEVCAAQYAGGKDDVQVEVVAQLLVPSVHHGDEAGLPFEFPLRVFGEANERFIDGAEEHPEQNLLVLEDEWVEFEPGPPNSLFR
jgi:hypothetical protein